MSTEQGNMYVTECLSKSTGITKHVAVLRMTSYQLNYYLGIKYLKDHDIDVHLTPTDEGLICSYKPIFGLSILTEFCDTEYACQVNKYLKELSRDK